MKTRFGVGMAGVLLSTAYALGLMGGRAPVNPTAAKHEMNGYQEASKSPGTLIGLQYESYFTKHNVSWETSQASGAVGLYNLDSS